MINEGEVKKRNKAAKKAWEAGVGSKAYINRETDPNTGKPIDSSEKGEYHKAIMQYGTIPAWKRVGRTMRGNKKMDEQFIDRVINILIEQGKKGFMPNPLRGTPSRKMMRDVRASNIANIRGKRLLQKLGAGEEEPKKEEPKINDSKFIDRVINILVEMRLDEETPHQLKAAKRAGRTPRSANKPTGKELKLINKATGMPKKGNATIDRVTPESEDALNRMFGIGKREEKK